MTAVVLHLWTIDNERDARLFRWTPIGQPSVTLFFAPRGTFYDTEVESTRLALEEKGRGLLLKFVEATADGDSLLMLCDAGSESALQALREEAIPEAIREHRDTVMARPHMTFSRFESTQDAEDAAARFNAQVFQWGLDPIWMEVRGVTTWHHNRRSARE